MKRILTLIIVTLLLVSVFPMNAFALSDSGSAGKNCEYKYDSRTKTLTIYPIDPDHDASIERKKVFTSYNFQILIIEEGIEEIESDAFLGCESLRKVVIKEGTMYIGMHVFSGCSSLKSIEFPETLSKVGNKILSGCPVNTIVFRGDAPNMSTNAFSETTSSKINIYTKGCWKPLEGMTQKGIKYLNLSKYTGTMQGYGNLWIIVGISVVALVAVAVVLEKKKKHE